MESEQKNKRTFAFPSDVFHAYLKGWAYDYFPGNRVAYVNRGNVAFIQEKLNESGFGYIKVMAR